jgi:hypothetical protein
MSMPRGLHPETRPQREGRPGHWLVPLPSADQVEYRDAPMRAVGKGIAWIIVGLLVIVGAVLVFTSAIEPRSPLMAGTAAARFHTPAPPLLVAAPADRAALERAHRGPSEAALKRAVDQVVQQGWGDTSPPPSRRDVAMHRAQAGR